MKRAYLILLVFLLVCPVAAGADAKDKIPAETPIIVSLDEPVSTEHTRVGQRVRGSVAEDVVVNGRVMIPRGAPVEMVVMRSESAGRLRGQARLWLRIDTIEIGGQRRQVTTRWSGQTGKDASRRNVVAIGGGAGAGAIVGGIAGGGKGAAIGGAVGAAAGTAGAALTRDREIDYPAETRLRFRVRQPIAIH